MVSSKQGNRRRGGVKNNARRFKAGGSLNGLGFNPRAGINAMFSASQIPDNPGYVDFNEPTVPIMPALPPVKKNKNERFNRRSGGHKGGGRNQSGKSWSAGNRIPGQNLPLPPLPPPPGRNFRSGPGPRGRPMPPPMGMPMRPPIRPPIPPNAGRFPPRPLMPAPIPMANIPMPPPLLPPRRPPMRGGPLPPRSLMPRGAGGPPPGPMRRNKNIQSNRKNENKNRRRGPNRSGQKNRKTITKKTLNEIINQYPLDKPWVTDEIKEEHRKKEEIENKLKGNKDDKLFAEFKVQRDKFVNLYESARLEYIGKHPEQDVEKIMTESDKTNKAENSNANANANANVNENTNETKAKPNENQTTQQQNVDVVTVVVDNNSKNKNDTPKTDVNIEKKSVNINNDEKQKPVEKPKQAVVAKETPKAITKPRVTRARGKVSK